jgi:hypothetical protein
VGLTNTALEGCMGSFPAEVQAAIYASRDVPAVLRQR